MARIARLIHAHLDCLAWDGSTLRFRQARATYIDQTHEDWLYYMTWSQEARIALARRIMAPFVEYSQKEIGVWTSGISNEQAAWINFLIDVRYELTQALSGALSLPSAWYFQQKKA